MPVLGGVVWPHTHAALQCSGPRVPVVVKADKDTAPVQFRARAWAWVGRGEAAEGLGPESEEGFIAL